MAEDEPDEIPTPAEQPVDVKVEEPKKDPAEPKPELKSQMMGLVTLLVVFGLLWGLVKVLPSLSDKLGTGISSVVSKEDGEKGEVETPVEPPANFPAKAKSVESTEPVVAVAKLKSEPEEIVEAVSAPVPAETAAVPQESPKVANTQTDDSIPEDKVKAQILEAIGGAERGEVRHIAFSSDLSKMIASLKMTPESGDAKLIEVIFERDDFGRYISAENSPFDTPIKIWK